MGKMGEKKEILLRNGAKFIFEEPEKRIVLSTPEDKKGYITRVFEGNQRVKSKKASKTT